jgi:hypothetical protein
LEGCSDGVARTHARYHDSGQPARLSPVQRTVGRFASRLARVPAVATTSPRAGESPPPNHTVHALGHPEALRVPVQRENLHGVHREGSMPIRVSASVQFPLAGSVVSMPAKAAEKMMQLARRVQGGPSRKERLEVLKEHFSTAMGQSCSTSSSADWAEADLDMIEVRARESAAGYIVAWFNAMEALSLEGATVPGIAVLNEVLREESVPFRIEGDELLRSHSSVQAVAVPESPDQVVRDALNDARTLSANGVARSVDRLHTAIHGYFLNLARAEKIAVDESASTARLFRVLRDQHPGLHATGPRAADITKMLQALAGAVEALSPLRNHASPAHPNPVLDAPEAEAFANCVNTIFSYVIASVERCNREALQTRAKGDAGRLGS